MAKVDLDLAKDVLFNHRRKEITITTKTGIDIPNDLSQKSIFQTTEINRQPNVTATIFIHSLLIIS